jgi:O-antigen ligase
MIISSVIAYNNDTFDEYTFRKSGGTEDPNDFAAQLLPTMFITYYLFKENKSWIFLLSSMAIFIYTLAYAGSKTSILSLGVLMAIILIVRFRSIISSLFTAKGLASLVLILTLGGGGAYYMSQTSAVKGMQGRASKTGTMQQRFIVWRAGGEMIRDNFFLGVGFGQFPKVSKNYLKDYLADEALPSHNNFVKMFAESGVFSFIAYLMFLGALFFTKRREIFESDYLWIYLGSLATVLMSMTIPSLHHKDYWIFLSLVSYAIYHFYKEDEIEEESYIEANQG